MKPTETTCQDRAQLGISINYFLLKYAQFPLIVCSQNNKAASEVSSSAPRAGAQPRDKIGICSTTTVDSQECKYIQQEYREARIFREHRGHSRQIKFPHSPACTNLVA